MGISQFRMPRWEWGLWPRCTIWTNFSYDIHVLKDSLTYWNFSIIETVAGPPLCSNQYESTVPSKFAFWKWKILCRLMYRNFEFLFYLFRVTSATKCLTECETKKWRDLFKENNTLFKSIFLLSFNIKVLGLFSVEIVWTKTVMCFRDNL